MSTVDLDLDAVARPDLRVKLGGVVWRLPGGPRSETVVEIASLFDAFDKAVENGDSEGLKSISDDIWGAMYGLFEEREQAQSLEDLPRLDDEQMAEIFKLLVQQIQSARAEAEEEEAADDERPTSPTSTAKPRSGARSRPSSARSRKPKPSAAKTS